MKILYIWDADYPWDIRVEKVTGSLVRQGHELHLVCRNKGRRPLEEVYQGLHLHRLPYLPAAFGSTLNEAYTFPAFCSPVWLSRILAVIHRNNCQLIMVRDLPMAPAALLAGRRFGIPVILDMAECYPEMLRSIWRFSRFKWRNILLRNPLLADGIERMVMKRIDHVLVMVEESRQRLLSMGVPPAKIHIVSNTPEPARFPVETGAARRKGHCLRLVYVGLVNPSRGLDTAINAAAEYVRNGGRLELIIAGSGKDVGRLEKMVAALGLRNVVRFPGWIDNRQVPALIAGGDVCVVPHHRCGHWDHTVPNKLFDYMAAAKPVLVSDVLPMARIVRETGCGLVYQAGQAKDFVACLKRLENSSFRQLLGRAGRAAVEKKYNWQQEEKILLRLMDRLAGDAAVVQEVAVQQKM